MSATTTTVRAGPAMLNVRSAGSGPALVLLPGLGRPAQDLDPLAGRLRAAGYRVILPDPRGDGASTGPLDGLTLHDLATDVATVIEAFDLHDVTIVGHAFGNRVARCLAADRPDLVARVVLLGCSGKIQPTPEIAEAIRLAQAVDTPDDAREDAVRAAWFGPDADITPWMSGWSQPVMKAYLAAAAATDIADWWTAGRAAVLIIQGAADVAAPPENGHLLKEEIGDRAELRDLPGVGHSVAIEAPDAVAAAISDYLERVGGRAP